MPAVREQDRGDEGRIHEDVHKFTSRVSELYQESTPALPSGERKSLLAVTAARQKFSEAKWESGEGG